MFDRVLNTPLYLLVKELPLKLLYMPLQNQSFIIMDYILSLCEKRPNMEFFLVRSFYGKIRTEKTLYLDTFHAVFPCVALLTGQFFVQTLHFQYSYWFSANRQANEVKKFSCFNSSYSFAIIIHHIFMTCNVRLFSIWRANTAWKMSKYRVFSDPYCPVFGLNAEIYGVNLRFQSEYRKIRTRKNSVFGHFLRSVIALKWVKYGNHYTVLKRFIPKRYITNWCIYSPCWNEYL